MYLAKNLKRLREKGGYTYDGLSKLTGVTKPHLHDLEKGKVNNVGIQTLLKITKPFNITLSEFIGEGLVEESDGSVLMLGRKLRQAELSKLTDTELNTLELGIDMAIALIKQNRNV